MPAQTLFTVPIPGLKDHVGGEIVCTEPAPQVYLLTFASPPDNRLTPAFNSAMLTALDLVEHKYPTGVLVTTSSIGKFYSNGLDLQLAVRTPGFFADSLFALFRRVLTYPMPTVALVNGHAFAGGLMLAMHHDYRVFGGGDRGYLCVNELDFGAPLLPPMAGIFRARLRPDVFRATVLQARRWTGAAALEAGLVDGVDGWAGVEALVREHALTTRGKSGVYGLLKAEMYREQVALLDDKDVPKLEDLTGAEKVRKAEVKARVEGGAKL
ncbi:enoyl-CoA hydratase/isomerase family protein [Xylariales sp. PMI_506]|nr:enoyl-CoA hydratase/isomerase family protein [Xylariales sp. PMI_506]